MIGEALTLTAPDCRKRPVFIIETKRSAGVVAKIKFREIAMQVLLGAMLIDTTHTALKD